MFKQILQIKLCQICTILDTVSIKSIETHIIVQVTVTIATSKPMLCNSTQQNKTKSKQNKSKQKTLNKTIDAITIDTMTKHFTRLKYSKQSNNKKNNYIYNLQTTTYAIVNILILKCT